jgi:hypothetical protein
VGGSDGSDGAGRDTPEICSFDINGAPSAVIPTVGVIDWSTDLQGLTEARIEFSLDDPQAGELNVGGGGAISVSERRALMLGLKPGRRYTYRIVATAGKTICVSADRSLSTQADPDAPALQRVAGASPASRAKGFIVTCSYRSRVALIIDADGEVVWRAAAPTSCSRAHMDWDGKYMWMMTANAATGSPAGGTSGDVRRVLMDGTGEEKIAGLERSHHDFAVLPEGAAAFLIVGAGGYTDVVERAAGGTMRMVVHLDGIGYGGTSSAGSFHPNALRYYARDDGYTVGDVSLPGVVQFNRQGKVLWRATGTCGTSTPESQCPDMAGTHGHQLLSNGNLIYFKANYGGPSGVPSPVKEYSFATGGTPTATLVWSYVGENDSLILGDVQRLGNGNTLVTYSTDGVIAEVSPTAALVQTLAYPSSQFGYSTFRETLYGPPQ